MDYRTEFNYNNHCYLMDLHQTGAGIKHNVSKTEENGLQSNTTKEKKIAGKSFIVEKVFQNRDSLLTEMFKIPHVNALFNMFLAFMILMILKTILSDWVTSGIFVHMHHIWWVSNEFAKPLVVIGTLVLLYVICVLVFLSLRLWLYCRRELYQVCNLVDFVFISVYLILYGLVVYVPVYVAVYIVLPPCSASFIVYEQVRLVMKLHAYMRSIVPEVIKEMKECCEGKKPWSKIEGIVQFKQYLYFMIIPTLVFRHQYPKRDKVNYGFVAMQALQFVLCITFMYNIFIVLMRDNFADFNPSFWQMEVLCRKFFQSLLPTVLMMLTMFYCFLHSWLNMFAELTKFGDRLFYSDWWNATSLSDYYRTWNVLVHDWLYNYIYKDIVIGFYFVTGNQKLSKALGSVGVFFVSALVHEYILAYCFRFFYPVLLVVFFVFGSSLYFVKAKRTSRLSNVLLWTCLYLGNSIFLTCYSFEWYARRNCRRMIDSYVDYIVPRSIFCDPL